METFGVEFGNPDLVKYAEIMGAVGMRVDKAAQSSGYVKRFIARWGCRNISSRSTRKFFVKRRIWKLVLLGFPDLSPWH